MPRKKNTVYLYNDKVVITFNYKEDAETVILVI